MPRVAWLTDIHLNFLPPRGMAVFLREVANLAADALLLGGDIAEGRDLVHYLEQIAAHWTCPVYFVLGNHDFYFSSIDHVRREVRQLCEQFENLHYLTQRSVIELTPQVGLIGHDGWADARLGDYEQSEVMLNDYALIQELDGFTRSSRRPILEGLGDEAAAHIRRHLPQAAAKFREVYLLTHVPPFKEACWHNGQLSNDEWLPHFTCQAAGAAAVDVMRQFPQCQLTILCGHTHSPGECQPLHNLRVLTGEAVYQFPRVQSVIELPAGQ